MDPCGIALQAVSGRSDTLRARLMYQVASRGNRMVTSQRSSACKALRALLRLFDGSSRLRSSNEACEADPIVERCAGVGARVARRLQTTRCADMVNTST